MHTRAPVVLHKPTGQPLQLIDAVAAGSGLKEPASHLVHAIASVTALKEPDGHSSQEPWLGFPWNFPLGQLRQVGAAGTPQQSTSALPFPSKVLSHVSTPRPFPQLGRDAYSV